MSALHWIVGGVSAVIVGVALGWFTASSNVLAPLLPGGQTIRVGAWDMSLATGGTDADMFTRARVARTGLLALNRSETLYFSAVHDDEGRPLDTRCRYEVTGAAPQAKWWSLTVYADDHFLVPDPSHRHSISLKDAPGEFRLTLGGDGTDALWLPTGKSGSFSLLLRLYNPADAIAQAPATARLPKIKRIGECR